VSRIAFDTTISALDLAGTARHIRALEAALRPVLGERLVALRSRLAAPHESPRTTGAMARTLARDLWWHQVGVERAARRAGAALLHLPAAVGPVRGRLPSVVTIHDLHVLHAPWDFRPWFRRYARAVIPRLARRAARVIAVSEYTRRDVIEHLGLPEHRVVTVPNGVAPNGQPSAVSEPVAANIPERYVLSVGTLEPRKNLLRLFQAIRLLADRPATRDVVLLHAGGYGWLADGIVRAARTPALGARVRLLGYVPQDDLACLYRRARLLAYPSLSEGFGLPVIEAMAAGCPVVAADRSALPEVAGDAALLVDPESVEAIADGIQRVWEDDALARDLAARGLVRARLYSWERTARLTAEVYASVLG
jgi:glycosyltransferase involved in cell wall biosynthesis